MDTLFTKKKIEVFFQAINWEYEDLDNDFRRCICLWNRVTSGSQRMYKLKDLMNNLGKYAEEAAREFG